MSEINRIQYGTSQYQMTLMLRNEVMRKPLGLDIRNEDFSWEKEAEIIGMFENEALQGVGVMSHQKDEYKIEYLCVDTKIQSQGIGAMLISSLEEIAKKNNARKIIMDARVSAQNFYERQGYHSVGEIFVLDYAPVDHIQMEKILKGE